ncbi:50S ribosomal protein L25/general stress protein Ctc [Ornithinibacillus californiensis]|uniref:50S ribosomal protein L25/general stress protein Ctc n=1 Tax=Ornithinibacillus californiensis TaxID=161536 RepID=UPI00064D9331|nr:50S ribosomal protein L25/general stress protein Ctc [Ornithinibacillus californiensis]
MPVTLTAMKREDHAKSATKLLRNSGKIPAVVYGSEKESKSISVDSIELLKTVRDEGKNAIISLQVQGESPVNVMLHDYQTDNIKDHILHADFYMVNMTQEMETTVPVRLVGEPENGVVQQPLYEVNVRATPNNFPNEITVDISNKSIGDIITVAEIGSTGSYEVVDDPETVVASVLAPNTNADMEGQQETGEEPEFTGEAQTDRNED